MKKRKLYCPVRKELIVETPEEKVRIAFLHHLICDLGYSSHMMVVEKKLNQLPHLCYNDALPNRRIDLLIYAKGKAEGLDPLLLIEFKQGPFPKNAFAQLVGYNVHIGAKYSALINEASILFGETAPFSLEKFPAYSEITTKI